VEGLAWGEWTCVDKIVDVANDRFHLTHPFHLFLLPFFNRP
jgi:hypothetical protein